MLSQGQSPNAPGFLPPLALPSCSLRAHWAASVAPQRSPHPHPAPRAHPSPATVRLNNTTTTINNVTTAGGGGGGGDGNINNLQVLTPPTSTAFELPKSYDAMRKEAIAAALEAVSAGEKLVELNFPPVPNMATAALNELLDANRAFAREFLFACRPRFAPSTLHAVFPDASEARLAARFYGPDRPFLISALPSAARGNAKDVPSFVSDNPPGLVVVVSPGFNVSEWIAMEKLEGSLPIIAINADLDKVRGRYYPRLFYPGLHAVKDRFLSRFRETYYLKMFSNGGTLLRRLPDVWRLFYNSRDGQVVQIWQGEERPDFADVEKLLAKTRAEDMVRNV